MDFNEILRPTVKSFVHKRGNFIVLDQIFSKLLNILRDCFKSKVITVIYYNVMKLFLIAWAIFEIVQNLNAGDTGDEIFVK